MGSFRGRPLWRVIRFRAVSADNADHAVGLEKRARDVAHVSDPVEPELLVSANPGCTLQIQSQLGAAGASIRTAHPIEVLDASIRGGSL